MGTFFYARNYIPLLKASISGNNFQFLPHKKTSIPFQELTSFSQTLCVFSFTHTPLSHLAPQSAHFLQRF